MSSSRSSARGPGISSEAYEAELLRMARSLCGHAVDDAAIAEAVANSPPSGPLSLPTPPLSGRLGVSGSGGRRTPTPQGPPAFAIDVAAAIARTERAARDLLDAAANAVPSTAPGSDRQQQPQQLRRSSSSMSVTEPELAAQREALAREQRAALIARFSALGPPRFTAVLPAKAFLQQSHNLGVREDFARRELRGACLRWWRDAALPLGARLHAAATEQHMARLRLALRETEQRAALVDASETADRAALARRVRGRALRGSGGSLSAAECRGGGASRDPVLLAALEALVQDEAAYRCYLIASHESAVAGFASAAEACRPSSSSSSGSPSTAIAADESATAGRSLDVVSRLYPRPVTAQSTLASVDCHAMGAARRLDLFELSAARAGVVRDESHYLRDALLRHRVRAHAKGHAHAEAVRREASRRRRELLAAREAAFARQRAEARVETLAFERLAYERRHPAVADAFQSLMLPPLGAASNGRFGGTSGGEAVQRRRLYFEGHNGGSRHLSPLPKRRAQPQPQPRQQRQPRQQQRQQSQLQRQQPQLPQRQQSQRQRQQRQQQAPDAEIEAFPEFSHIPTDSLDNGDADSLDGDDDDDDDDDVGDDDVGDEVDDDDVADDTNVADDTDLADLTNVADDTDVAAVADGGTATDVAEGSGVCVEP